MPEPSCSPSVCSVTAETAATAATSDPVATVAMVVIRPLVKDGGAADAAATGTAAGLGGVVEPAARAENAARDGAILTTPSGKWRSNGGSGDPGVDR